MIKGAWFLAMILLSLFPSLSQAQDLWSIQEIHNSQKWTLYPQKAIRLAGIKPVNDNSCHQRVIRQYLNQTYRGQAVELVKHKTIDTKDYYILKDKNSLIINAELIRLGLADLNPMTVSAYYMNRWSKLVKLAQQEKRGLHQMCSKIKNGQHFKQLKTSWHRFRRLPYLAGDGFLATGSHATSGNAFVTTDNVAVEIIGLTPLEPRNESERCFADQAQHFLNKIIAGKAIYLQADREIHFQDQTLKRHAYVYDIDGRQKLLSLMLIRDGFGRYKPYGENDQYENRLKQSQAEAYIAGNGAWTTCLKKVVKTELEKAKTEHEVKKKPLDENCPIKGNVSGSKKTPKKTFHTPASGWYTRIQPERCFNTEQEAVEAGFLKVK